MKLWIKTKIVGKGTDEDPRRPYLANQTLPASMIDLGNDTCLCRVAGTPEQISTITGDTDITQLTDEEARKIIKSKYPNSDLENLDVADPEIDKIAKAQGIDPKIRADVVISSRGRQVLQDQENYLMAHICEKILLTRDYWDTEAAKTTKWEKGINIEHSIKDGHAEAHEFVLSRIRKKIGETTTA